MKQIKLQLLFKANEDRIIPWDPEPLKQSNDCISLLLKLFSK